MLNFDECFAELDLTVLGSDLDPLGNDSQLPACPTPVVLLPQQIPSPAPTPRLQQTRQQLQDPINLEVAIYDEDRWRKATEEQKLLFFHGSLLPALIEIFSNELTYQQALLMLREKFMRIDGPGRGPLVYYPNLIEKTIFLLWTTVICRNVDIPMDVLKNLIETEAYEGWSQILRNNFLFMFGTYNRKVCASFLNKISLIYCLQDFFYKTNNNSFFYNTFTADKLMGNFIAKILNISTYFARNNINTAEKKITWLTNTFEIFKTPNRIMSELAQHIYAGLQPEPDAILCAQRKEQLHLRLAARAVNQKSSSQPWPQENQSHQLMPTKQNAHPINERPANMHTLPYQNIATAKSVREILALYLYETLAHIYSDLDKRDLLLSNIIGLYGEFYLLLDQQSTEEFLKKIEQLLHNKTADEIPKIIEDVAKCIAENRIIFDKAFKTGNHILVKILEEAQKNQKDTEVILLKNASAMMEKPPPLVVLRALEYKMALLQSPDFTADNANEKKYITLFFNKIDFDNETPQVDLYYGVITFDKNGILIKVSTLKDEEQFFFQLYEKLSSSTAAGAKKSNKIRYLLTLFDHMQSRMCYIKKFLTPKSFTRYFQSISTNILLLNSIRVLGAPDESLPSQRTEQETTKRSESGNTEELIHKRRSKPLTFDSTGIRALHILKAYLQKGRKKPGNYSRYSFADMQSIGRNQSYENLALQLPKLRQKVTLYPYQEQAIKEALRVIVGEKRGFILAHDMGLGKTIEALGILEALDIKTGYILIICPAAVIYVWQREIIGKGGYSRNCIQILNSKQTQLIPHGILLITYDQLTILSKSPANHPIKEVLNWISIQNFGLKNLPKATVIKLNKDYCNTGKNLRKIFPTLDDIEPDALFKSKEFMDFMNKFNDLTDMQWAIKFLCAKSLYTNLIKKGYISPSGMALKAPDVQLNDEKQLIIWMFNGWLPSRFKAKLRTQLSPIENIDEYLHKLFGNDQIVALLKELLTTCKLLLEQALNPQLFQLSAIIIDEAHELRNKKSEQTRVIAEIMHKIAEYKEKNVARILLTGTPIQNNIKEFWTLLDTANPGMLSTTDGFCKPFGIILSNLGNLLMEDMEGANCGEILTENLLDAEKQFIELRRIVSSHISRLTRTNSAVTACAGSMPKIIKVTWPWSLSETQCKQRDGMDMNAILSACPEADYFEVSQSDEPQSSKSKKKGYALLIEYRQILLHPLLVTENAALYKPKMTFLQKKHAVKKLIRKKYHNNIEAFIKESGKLSVFIHNITEIFTTNPNHQVLCVVDSIPILIIIEHILTKKKIKCVSYHGSLSSEERTKIIAKFNDRKQNQQLLIISEDAGGVGISCPHITHIVVYSTGWNPYVTEQAIARGLRITSKNPSVFVIDMQEPTDPCEQKIRAMMQAKLDIGAFFTEDSSEIATTEEEQKKLHLATLRFLIEIAFYTITREVVIPNKQKIIAYIDKLKKSIIENGDLKFTPNIQHVEDKKEPTLPAKLQKTNSGIALPVACKSQEQEKTSPSTQSSTTTIQHSTIISSSVRQGEDSSVLQQQIHVTVNVAIQQPTPVTQSPKMLTECRGSHFFSTRPVHELTQRQMLSNLLRNMEFVPTNSNSRLKTFSTSSTSGHGHKVIYFLNQQHQTLEIQIEHAVFEHACAQLRFISIYLAAYTTMHDNNPNKKRVREIIIYSLQLKNNEDLIRLINDVNMTPETLTAIAKMADVFRNNPGRSILDYIRNGNSAGISLCMIDRYFLDGLVIKYQANQKKKISEQSITYLNDIILVFIEQYNGACCTAARTLA